MCSTWEWTGMYDKVHEKNFHHWTTSHHKANMCCAAKHSSVPRSFTFVAQRTTLYINGWHHCYSAPLLDCWHDFRIFCTCFQTFKVPHNPSMHEWIVSYHSRKRLAVEVLSKLENQQRTSTNFELSCPVISIFWPRFERNPCAQLIPLLQENFLLA